MNYSGKPIKKIVGVFSVIVITIVTAVLSGTIGEKLIEKASLNAGNSIETGSSKSVVLNDLKNEFMRIGDTITIADPGGYTWSSSNPDVASISGSGVITGKKVGYTTITGINGSNRFRAIINVYSTNDDAITVPMAIEMDDSTIVLKEDGTVWTVGRNGNGQLGNGTRDNSYKPVRVKTGANTYLSNVMKVSAGKEFVMAMTSNGDVYAWGYGQYGKIAQGPDVGSEDQVYAVKMKTGDATYITDAIDIACGCEHSMIATRDGKMYVCGQNEFYQDSTTDKTSKYYMHDTGMSAVIKITGGYSACGAMLSNGETYAWGENPYGAVESNPSPGLLYKLSDEITWFDFSGYCSYIIKEDGTLWSTGRNNKGQLGLGDTNDRSTYTQVSVPNGETVKYVVANGSTLVVQTHAGKVYVCGYNGYGELADGGTSDKTELMLLKDNDGNAITDCLMIGGMGENTNFNTQGRNIILVRNDGTIWMAGDNEWAQFGSYEKTGYKELHIFGGANGSLNIRQKQMEIGDKFNVDVESEPYFNVFVDAIDQTEYEFTSSNSDVAQIDKNTGVITAKSVGYTTIVAKNSDGGSARAVVYVRNKGAIAMPQNATSEYGAVVALKEDGTVWGSGLNSRYELAQGDTDDRQDIVRIKKSSTEYLDNIIQISAGTYHFIALDKDGCVWTWGKNNYGQLGLGDTDDRGYETKVISIPGKS